jgi:hypothetical protein
MNWRLCKSCSVSGVYRVNMNVWPVRAQVYVKVVQVMGQIECVCKQSVTHGGLRLCKNCSDSSVNTEGIWTECNHKDTWLCKNCSDGTINGVYIWTKCNPQGSYICKNCSDNSVNAESIWTRCNLQGSMPYVNGFR